MKTIVITGGNSGLGLETAKILATDKSNKLILGCRDLKKAQVEAEIIKTATGNKNIYILPLDLSSFQSVKNFAVQLKQSTDKIDALVCNAGLQITKGTQVTKEGFEMTFGVNHLGHFLLTNLLLPAIDKMEGRIIIVSSGTHFNPPIWQSSMFGIPGAEYLGWKKQSAPDNYETYPESKRGYARYATSKLCELMFGYELNRKLTETKSKITVNVFDPGLMPGSGLAREGAAIEQWAWRNIMPVLRIFNGVNSIKTSAKHMSLLITGTQFSKVTGQYFEELKQRPSSVDSYKKDLWNDLWTGSEQLISKAFNI